MHIVVETKETSEHERGTRLKIYFALLAIKYLNYINFPSHIIQID